MEGNFSDDSVCDRYLAQAAEVLASDCKTGIVMCLEFFCLQPVMSSWHCLYSNDITYCIRLSVMLCALILCYKYCPLMEI